MPLLSVEKLSVKYGKVEALRAATLHVDKGQIVTVIGPNGAGKSTLLNALMNLHASSGHVTFDECDLQYIPTVARVRSGLCLVPEKRELFATMTVEDNLWLGSYTRGKDKGSRVDALNEVFGRFPRLRERRTQLAGTLSGGERQMLAIGRALMSAPRLLMLDEPSLGLAPLIVRDIFKIIQELREAGVSVLLVEQNARAAMQIADYGYVLETGEIVLEGPTSSLSEDPRVVETYLGLGGKRGDRAERSRWNPSPALRTASNEA